MSGRRGEARPRHPREVRHVPVAGSVRRAARGVRLERRRGRGWPRGRGGRVPGRSVPRTSVSSARGRGVSGCAPSGDRSSLRGHSCVSPPHPKPTAGREPSTNTARPPPGQWSPRGRIHRRIGVGAAAGWWSRGSQEGPRKDERSPPGAHSDTPRPRAEETLLRPPAPPPRPLRPRTGTPTPAPPAFEATPPTRGKRPRTPHDWPSRDSAGQTPTNGMTRPSSPHPPGPPPLPPPGATARRRTGGASVPFVPR
ncbi:hypothetical protein ABIC27_000492 [Streptomyces sp. PvR034]